MNLTDALITSQPLFPTRQLARTVLPGRGSVSVAYDGKFVDVGYLGCPYIFLPQQGEDYLAEAQQFLQGEGIPLEEGWTPQVSRGGGMYAARC